MRRFLLHTLWVVLPFCILVGLSWNAWRADAETRRRRLLESSNRCALLALDQSRNRLGAWSPISRIGSLSAPPLPSDDLAARKVRERYEAGDYEGVMGSAESVRSEAGLPLRALAALQLLRRETDPGRLGELVAVLAGPMDFVSPLFLEAAERRFSELKIPAPLALTGWRARWQRATREAELARRLVRTVPAAWMEQGGQIYLVETDGSSGNWRVSEKADVEAAVATELAGESNGVAEGLGISISVAGKTVAGPNGKFVLSSSEVGGWKTEVVAVNQEAYLRSEVRTRNVITAVIVVAGLAVLFGLVQAGRAYLRAVELARRQSEFMAAVSHEMRTPLTAMRLLAENLESGVADRAGQREEHTRLIREECARLGDLVGNVLAFSGGGIAEPFEAFDVAAMVADAASLVKPMAVRRGIDFECTSADFPEPPSGDVAALRRALLNLLDNALKHTPDGGKVSCRVFAADAELWKMEVSDTGPGIPIAERGRVFEAFYRIGDELRRTTPGTGLGLALVKRTAEAHGGTITVSDAVGGGSIFTLTLPLKP